MNEPDVVAWRGGRNLTLAALGVAIVGLALLLGGASIEPRRAIFAYLTALNYAITTAVGALVFLMIGHAMRAGWPTLVRRLTEAIVGTLPLLAVLFVPVLVGMRALYAWHRPETIADLHARHLVEMKVPYLNGPWFVGRAAFYFAVWMFVGFWLRRWSRAMDVSSDPVAKDRMFAMSGVLLPLVGLTFSFAGFDWVMSLTPTWASTMFPVCYFAGGFLAALALLTLLTWAADRAGVIRGINESHYYALGRLLLAFVIFWAYTEYFQLMLIWIADKPDEVTYYLARVHGGWRAWSVVLVLGQFVVPFFALLSYDLKRRRDGLAAVAAWLLVAHYVDVAWMVMPVGRPAGAVYHWIDLGALLAVSGVAVAFGAWRLRGAAMVPVHDPALAEALRYDSV